MRALGKEREMEEEEVVEDVCNGERVRETKRERECVPTWSVWSWGKLHSTVGSRGN